MNNRHSYGFRTKGLNSAGVRSISEVTNVTNHESDLQRMLDKITDSTVYVSNPWHLNHLYTQITTKDDIKISGQDRKILASLSRHS